MRARVRWALVTAVMVWGSVVVPAHGWWFTTGFDCSNWRAANDGHEGILKEAVLAISQPPAGSTADPQPPPGRGGRRVAPIPVHSGPPPSGTAVATGRVQWTERHIRDICFGVRDNDQNERALLPFGGANVRHHSSSAQRTHSMLPVHDRPGDFAYLGRRGFEKAVREAQNWVVSSLMRGLRSFENQAVESSVSAWDVLANPNRAGELLSSAAAGTTRMGAYLSCKRTRCQSLGTALFNGCNRYRRCPATEQAKSGGACQENYATYPQSQQRQFDPIERECLQRASSTYRSGRGRAVRRSSAAEAQGQPGDNTRYTGFQWLGKALHALQDGYSCAHAVRNSSGALCELLSYQGTCTPGSSKIHRSFDSGDNTRTCRWSADAKTATVRVIRAFMAARQQLISERVTDGGVRRVRAQQFRSQMVAAVAPSYQMSPTNCQRGPSHRTWGERYRALGRPLPVGIPPSRRIMTWADVARMNPGRNTQHRDDLRQEQSLICGQETTSGRMQDLLDSVFPRMGENCANLPGIVLGRSRDAGKIGEYFRENMSCAADALGAAWAAALDRFQTARDAARSAGTLTVEARARLGDLWRRQVCDKWKTFREPLQRLITQYRQLEQGLGRIKHEIVQIMHCLGLRQVAEAVSMSVQDVSDAWNRFKVQYQRWKATARAALRTQASAMVARINPTLRTRLRHLATWWNDTCLVERNGFLYNLVIAPLAQGAAGLARILEPILGRPARAVIRKVAAATREAGRVFQRFVGSGGRRLLQQGQALVRRLGPLAAPLRAMLSGSASSLTQALEHTNTALCSGATAGLRRRLTDFANWARGIVGSLVRRGEQAVHRVVERGQEYLEQQADIVRQYTERGWQLVRRFGQQAYNALRNFGRPIIARFEQCRNNYLRSGNETIQQCLIQSAVQPVQQAAQRAVQTARRAVARAFDAARYGSCLLGACLRSLRQCAARRGSDFDRDVGRCDRRYGYSSAATLDKARYIGCMASCATRSVGQAIRALFTGNNPFRPCAQRCASGARRAPPRPPAPPTRRAAAPPAAPRRPTPPPEPEPAGPERGGGTPHPSGLLVQENVRRPGYTYRHYTSSRRSPDACARACSRSRRCNAFTWRRRDGRCDLKRRVRRTRPGNGYVSGYKQSALGRSASRSSPGRRGRGS